MKFKLYKADGTESGVKELKNFPILAEGKGIDALRQCLLAIRSNKRQGNASTKTRDEVSGSGKKIYRQKGLGTGRAGDKRAIQRRGGGIAFGPKPRCYSQKINNKMRKLALTRALIDQANDGSVSLIEDWSVQTCKTKAFHSILSTIDSKSKSFLIIGKDFDANLSLAARNIPKVRLSKALNVSPSDLVGADQVVCSLEGMDELISKLVPVVIEKS